MTRRVCSNVALAASDDRAEPPRAAGGSAVSVSLTRGAAEVTPISETSQMFARIHTPDADFGLAGPVRVEYDAFTGTHRKVVNP